MSFSLGCSLGYHAKDETTFVFNLEASRFEGQTIVRETLDISPQAEIERWTMPESGNRYFRVAMPPGDVSVRYEAEVELPRRLEDPAQVGEVPAERLPMSVYPHLYPSRYCQSDKLLRFATRTFADLPQGHLRVTGICNWICDNVDYVSGSTDELTSAFDTVTERTGVCRDFAHLAIAICRALGIPARYVSAYAWRLDPPDFHAVIEAYLQGPSGGGWYLFDPTRMSGADGLVRIGIGRDAAEVAFCQVFDSTESEKPEVWITSTDDVSAPLTTRAVRSQQGPAD